MERDYRLTGTKRGQSTNVVAPKGFEVSNPWKVWFKNSVSGGCDETNACNSWRNGSTRTPQSIYQFHEFLFFAHSFCASVIKYPAIEFYTKHENKKKKKKKKRQRIF